jgi:hypothetical protein
MDEQRRRDPKEQGDVGFARHAGSVISGRQSERPENQSEHLDVEETKSLGTKVESSIRPSEQQRPAIYKHKA